MLVPNSSNRVVVTDGRALIANAIASMLDEEMEVVGVASTVEDMLRYVNGHKPEALILETPGIATPDNIIDLVEKIKELSPSTGIVLLCEERDNNMLHASLQAGIQSYASKFDGVERLVKAAGRAAERESYFCPSMVVTLVESRQVDGDDLSKRELDILKLIGFGYTSAEIGKQIHISVRTVESHRSSLQEKLGTTTRHELVKAALDRGLVR